MDGLVVVYLAVRSLFALVLLFGRADRSKELEILVLRHELALLRRSYSQPVLGAAVTVLDDTPPFKASSNVSPRTSPFSSLAAESPG